MVIKASKTQGYLFNLKIFQEYQLCPVPFFIWPNRPGSSQVS